MTSTATHVTFSASWDEDEFALADHIATSILDKAPGLLGKLVLLSSLRNGSRGEYSHSAFVPVVSPQLASQVLRDKHEETFSEWLNYLLEQQWKELTQYLDALEKRNPGAQRLPPKQAWETLVPTSASVAARKLFLYDLELVFGLAEERFAA